MIDHPIPAAGTRSPADRPARRPRGRRVTARTLAAAAATVFGVALLSAGLAYAIAGCLLAWWLLVDLGRAEA